MASDYRRKRRGGRKPNKLKVVTEEMKSFPESDFEKFMASLKNEPVKTEEENERESLIFKINKLKLEIENLKELKAIQSLRKSNNLLHIEVLQMRYKKLMEESQPSKFNRAQNTPSSSKDSINIKNVIYNNCAQTVQSEKGKKAPEVNKNTNYDPNFTYIASQLLSFFSDKMDANFASHVDSIKNYTYQIFKNEMENMKSEKKVSPIKIKLERGESLDSDSDSVKKYVVAEKSKECARKKTSVSSLPAKELRRRAPSPPVETSPPSPPPPPSVTTQSPKNKDLKFEFPEIKVKILEYLCGKVDVNMVVSAFRRLQRSKAYSMLKQTFDCEHNRLLRVYLFDDGNILVQDMTVCRNEFSKDMYHSIRYYAIILTAKDSTTPLQEFESPEPKAKQVEAVPEHTLRSTTNSKVDLIILQPFPDNVLRPRFKVDMVQDTMIYEEFELVSKKPFVIRPLYSEVVLTSAQLNLLKPLILKALSSSLQGMPVISIVPKSSNSEVLQEYAKQGDTNLFVIENNSSQSSYSLSEIKKVTPSETVIQAPKTVTESEDNQNKRKQVTNLTVPVKKPKPAEHISIVSVDDIMRGVKAEQIEIHESVVKKEEIEECIDLSDDEDEDTIVIG